MIDILSMWNRWGSHPLNPSLTVGHQRNLLVLNCQFFMIFYVVSKNIYCILNKIMYNVLHVYKTNIIEKVQTPNAPDSRGST